MPTARARSAVSRIAGRALIALGLVLVGINVASAIWEVRAAHERIERSAQRDFSNMTRLLAEQTAASLEAVDLMLREAVRTGNAKKVAAGMPRLRDELAQVPQIAAFLVLDAQGRVLACTNETPAIDPDLAGRPFFTAHRDTRADGLHVSDPYRGGTEGAQWRFLLSRRLNEPGGRFGGVVAAAIEIASALGRVLKRT